MAMVGGGAVAAEAASKYVGSPAYQQEQSNWCWVAAGKSLASYHKNSYPTQCTAYKWGKGGSSCPNDPGTLGNVYSILATAGLSNAGTIGGTRSFGDLQSDLNANRPAVVRWGWNSTGGSTGHMVVVRGYDNTYGNISYMDPNSGSYQGNSYSWLQSGGGHTWTHTLYGAVG